MDGVHDGVRLEKEKNDPAIDKGAEPDQDQSQTAVPTGRDKAVRRDLLKRATWIMLRWQSFGARRVGQG